MTQEEFEETRQYKAVVNHEERRTVLHLASRPGSPLGWNYAGKTGTKRECLDFINEVWTDMRPLSLRKQMEAQEVVAADAG
ncbi:MAG: MbtH family NRPS accessory protein [Acidobacteria bacterium]|nr:MbtH family NRPS accessory protein [Acidobacteriota bacterium]